MNKPWLAVPAYTVSSLSMKKEMVFTGCASFVLLYIYFNDETNKIILRYYSMHPLSQAKRSIEIPRDSFSKYEIAESLFGIKTKIILYQKVKGGVYKYPPVSISALSPAEKEQLIQSLNRML